MLASNCSSRGGASTCTQEAAKGVNSTAHHQSPSTSSMSSSTPSTPAISGQHGLQASTASILPPVCGATWSPATAMKMAPPILPGQLPLQRAMSLPGTGPFPQIQGSLAQQQANQQQQQQQMALFNQFMQAVAVQNYLAKAQGETAQGGAGVSTGQPPVPATLLQQLQLYQGMMMQVLGQAACSPTGRDESSLRGEGAGGEEGSERKDNQGVAQKEARQSALLKLKMDSDGERLCPVCDERVGRDVSEWKRHVELERRHLMKSIENMRTMKGGEAKGASWKLATIALATTSVAATCSKSDQTAETRQRCLAGVRAGYTKRTAAAKPLPTPPSLADSGLHQVKAATPAISHAGEGSCCPACGECFEFLVISHLMEGAKCWKCFEGYRQQVGGLAKTITHAPMTTTHNHVNGIKPTSLQTFSPSNGSFTNTNGSATPIPNGHLQGVSVNGTAAAAANVSAATSSTPAHEDGSNGEVPPMCMPDNTEQTNHSKSTTQKRAAVGSSCTYEAELGSGEWLPNMLAKRPRVDVDE